MSAITAKASRKMKKYAVLTREPRCFLGSFDFSWEQRKLGDIASDMVAGGDIDKDLILAEGQYPVIANALTGDGIVGYYDKEYRVNAPAVTVTGRGDVGHAKARLVNFTPVVRLLSVKSEHDVFFLENAINTLKIVIESTGVPQLTVPQLAKYEVAFPRQLDEEEHIGAFFKQLDHLITLHQRKCANLCSPSQVVFSLLFATSTFSWEQRKLGEIGSVSMCRRIFKEQTSETGDIPFYKIGTFGADPDAFISRELFEEYKSKYPYPQKGDILISASGSIGRTVEFAGNNEYFQDSNIVWLNHDERLSNPFLKCFYSVVKWAGIEGSTIKRLYNDNILNTVICMPSVPEQKRIGLFFENLDNLITLHQRECISFTGRADRLILTANKKRTTSSWEQRKLGEMGQTYTGLSGKTKDDFGHGQARFVTYMNVFSNPISNPEMTEPIEIDPKQNEVEVGDVFFTTSSETPEEVGMSSILLEKRGKTYLNSFCFGFRPSEKIDSYYLAYMLRSESTRAKIILLAQGISRYNISKNKVMEIAVSLPSLDEQKMIGQYFSQLDNLITLHQRKPFLMKWRTSDANRNQTNRLVL